MLDIYVKSFSSRYTDPALHTMQAVNDMMITTKSWVFMTVLQNFWLRIKKYWVEQALKQSTGLFKIFDSIE